MCETCGCSMGARPVLRDPRSGQALVLELPHTAPATRTVHLEQAILEKNDRLAQQTRRWLAERRILALNLVSSPGAGKTTVLERTLAELRDDLPLYVIEGDQASARDADRIRAAGCPALQINTGTGCHLDAAMVSSALERLAPEDGAIVFVENVGNLVCPALFDLGERAKVVVASTTEGEDKPLKYPHMFRAAGLVLLNKCDLIEVLGFDAAAFEAHVREVAPDVPILRVSARRPGGLAPWIAWVRELATSCCVPTPR